MEYLKRHLNDYEDASQKEPKAKRALIHTLYEVLSVAEIVEKEVKDKATFDTLFEKSVTPVRPQPQLILDDLGDRIYRLFPIIFQL